MFELLIILSRYLFIFLIAYFLYQNVVYIMAERDIIHADAATAVLKQRVAIAVLHTCAFSILAFEPESLSFKPTVCTIGFGALALFLFAGMTAERVYRYGCPVFFNGVCFLTDVGLIMIMRLNAVLAQRQLIWFFAAFISILVVPFIFRLMKGFEKFEFVYLFVGAALLASPFFFGSEKFGANNWIFIGGFSFQPSEIVKFLFVFYLASVFRKKLSLKQLVFPTAVTAAFVLILVYQRDLGGALIFFMTFMAVLYIATGDMRLFFAGIIAASAASVLAYGLFSHVRVRVVAWQNPWQSIDTAGYQIAQSLFAIGTWGPVGSGLTRGFPSYIPVAESDFIFAAICEEFGSIFGLLLIGVIMLVIYRGMHISLRCRRKHYAVLSAGLTGMLSFQTFLILGGNIKLIPLTGVTLPFVSYGGSSILASFMMVGILQWVYIDGEKVFKRKTFGVENL